MNTALPRVLFCIPLALALACSQEFAFKPGEGAAKDAKNLDFRPIFAHNGF